MNVVFPAQAEYSYFSADFTLKIIAYDISVCVSRARAPPLFVAVSGGVQMSRQTTLAVLALKNAFRTEIARWKRKYPILC